MTNGYFKLQRRFFAHALWEEERTFSKAEAFLDLLQLAAFKLTKKIVKGSLITLEPGQLCGSERYLSGRWNWSTKKVRAFLTLLEADRMVGIEKKREGSVITLRNYRKYCDMILSEEAQKKQTGSTEEAPRKQIEEGKERKEGGEEELPPTFEDVSKFAKSQPMGISDECIEAFYDEMEALQWTYKGFPCVVESAWHGRFRKWATNWANNAAGRKAQ